MLKTKNSFYIDDSYVKYNLYTSKKRLTNEFFAKNIDNFWYCMLFSNTVFLRKIFCAIPDRR